MDVPAASMAYFPRRKTACADGEILHAGDDLTTDVLALFAVGCRPAGLNLKCRPDARTQDSRLLPHIEISRLASLTSLI